MLGQTLNSGLNLLNGALGLVNTTLSAGACGLQTLNQNIQELGEPHSEAQKFLSQPSLAQQFLNEGKSLFQKPEFIYKHIGIKDNRVTFYDEEGNYFITDVPSNQMVLVKDALKLAKNVLNMLAIMNTGQATELSLVLYKANIKLVDLTNVAEETIKELARIILLAIEESNQ